MKLSILYALLSPTRALADLLKARKADKERKKHLIKCLNSIYLGLAIITTIIVLICQYLAKDKLSISLYNSIPIFWVWLWSYFLLSRANEIFGAFLKDAFDKMDNSIKPASSLTPSERIKLSLKSYLELLLNFSLLYSLTDSSLWKGCAGGVNENCTAPLKLTDSIYYSGITITTTGYGDITPINWYPQFLAVYEVFCGVILLVVCFAIYAARLGLAPNKTNTCKCHETETNNTPVARAQ
jgi:voltage-gated potassium channel